MWPWRGKLPEIWGFPFIISGTAEANDFKFGTQLRFAKAHHKITRIKKSGRGPGLKELPNIYGFSINIYKMAEDSDFKFGTQLGFAKAYHKIAHIRKRGLGSGLGELKKFGVFTLIFMQWVKVSTSNLSVSINE